MELSKKVLAGFFISGESFKDVTVFSRTAIREFIRSIGYWGVSVDENGVKLLFDIT